MGRKQNDINSRYNKPCKNNPSIKCVQPFINWLNPEGGCDCDPCLECVVGRSNRTLRG